MQFKKIMSLGALFLTLFFVLQAYNNIAVTQMEQQTDDLSDQISELTRHVTITGGEEDGRPSTAEKRFRGVVAGNFLMAQQCIYITTVYHGEDLEFESDEFDEEVVDGLRKEHNPGASDLDQLGSSEFGFIGFSENLLAEAIDETEFTGQCAGAEPIDIPSVPSLGGLVLGPIESFFSGARSVLGGEADHTGLKNMEGFSAQGVYGRVDFDIEQSFAMEEGGLMMMDLGEFGDYEDGAWLDMGPIAIGAGAEDATPAPDFPIGNRSAVFHPDGFMEDHDFSTTPEDDLEFPFSPGLNTPYDHADREDFLKRFELDEYSETKTAFLGDVGYTDNYPSFDETRYRVANLHHDYKASRIIMENVPLVAEPGFSLAEMQNAGDTGDQMEYLLENTYFVMCEGMEGYVQTNAGSPDAPGKQHAEDDPIPRDVPYGRVVVENRGSFDNEDLIECFEEIEDESEQSIELPTDGDLDGTTTGDIEWLDTLIFTHD